MALEACVTHSTKPKWVTQKLICCFTSSFVAIRHPSQATCSSNLEQQIGLTTNNLLVAWDGWGMVTNKKVKQHSYNHSLLEWNIFQRFLATYIPGVCVAHSMNSKSHNFSTLIVSPSIVLSTRFRIPSLEPLAAMTNPRSLWWVKPGLNGCSTLREPDCNHVSFEG